MAFRRSVPVAQPPLLASSFRVHSSLSVMARKPRAATATAATASVAPAPPSSIATSGTRSKRKASAISVSVAPSMGSSASKTVIATTPTAAAAASAISPALKKRRPARTKVNAIPFPALYGSKEVITFCDDEDDGGNGDGYRIVDVAVPAPTVTASDSEDLLPACVVNPDFYVPATYTSLARVLHQHGEYFHAMLTRACVLQAQTEFMLLQVLDVMGKGFYLWTRSGVVGTNNETLMQGPWPKAQDAIAKFRTLFMSKTLCNWDERHAHHYCEGSFVWIDTHQAMNSDHEEAPAAEVNAVAVVEIATTTQRQRRSSKKGRARAPRKVKSQPLTEVRVTRATLPSSTSPPPSRLDLQVQTFLTMLVDAASTYNSADQRFYAYSYATKKQPKKTKTNGSDDDVLVPIPLGKPSKATIAKGFEALHRLHDALVNHADHTQLAQLSSRFFSIVPHTNLVTIDSMMRLTEKVEMLVALSVHDGHTELLLPDLTHRYFARNHLDACYESLECRLIPLLPSSREYGLVQAYIFNSFCCVGNSQNSAEGKLVTVFRVEKESDATRFSAHRTSTKNRRVLWHGSRMSNWMGILKHGLLITPPGVPLNGSSLGAGLYFTDKISKAMSYSHPSHDRQVFLLSEVALGTCKPSTSGARFAASSTNAQHSCHGVGRCQPDSNGDYVDALGAIWPLGKATQTKDARATHGHNEFVVYNTAQARMRYIVVTYPFY